MHLISHIAIIRTHQRPLISQCIINFNRFLNIIELIQSSQFHNITILQSAKSWLRYCNVAIRNILELLIHQRILCVLRSAFLSWSASTNNVQSFVAVHEWTILSRIWDSTSIAYFLSIYFIQRCILLWWCGSTVNAKNTAIRGDNTSNLLCEIPAHR